jgi:hypothetical protein
MRHNHKSLVSDHDAAFDLGRGKEPMKRMFAIAILFLAPTPLWAQENCDVRSTVETRPGAIVFQQLLQCDDGDAIMTFSCKPGDRRVRVSLPYSSPTKGNGETLIADVQIDGKTVKRRFRVTSKATSEAMMEIDDPLWVALSAVGNTVQLSSEDGEGRAGLREEASASLDEWKQACGM